MSRLGYLFGEGFKGIFKHGFMSFATVAIMIACLIIMGSVSLLSFNIGVLIDQLEDQNEIVAFIDEELSDEQARTVESAIYAVGNVQSTEYIDRYGAMDTFMGNYSEELMEGIDVSVFRNRYVIQLEDIARMAETKQALENTPGIAKVNAHIDYAESFITIRNIVNAVSAVLIAILVFVSLFIMTNTVKLATYSRREEIGIMKMVGASNSFIRLPFVIEGLILGALGSLIAFVLQWGLYNTLVTRIGATANGLFSIIPFDAIQIPVLVAFLGVGVIVGVFGGLNAIKNYLKV